MKQVKVVVIDPFKQQIYDKEITQDHLPDMQGIVGGYLEAVGSLDNGDMLYVDEEGLLKDNQKFFKIPELSQDALAGVGFVQGHNKNGDGQDTQIGNLDLAMKVEWA